jgi:hypothetical protein
MDEDAPKSAGRPPSSDKSEKVFRFRIPKKLQPWLDSLPKGEASKIVIKILEKRAKKDGFL